MVAKKALRLTAAVALAGVTLGAGAVHGATSRSAVRASGVVTITDWQFPNGCGLGAASVADAEICGPMQDGLFGVDSKGNYYADLATTVPSQANGGAKVVNGNLVVTYTLKPNLKWSDDSAITPQDFVFGTKLSIAIGNTNGIDQISTIDVLNSTTMRVTYKGIYAPYIAFGAPALVAPQSYLQKKYGTTDFNTLVAKFLNDNYNSPSDVFSGPYKIQSYTNGQSIVLTPNTYYTALPPASGHPIPAQLKFVNITDNESGLATALQSSNSGVDKAEDFQPSDLPVLYGSKYRVTVQPAYFYEHMELNESGALKDVRLREALQYAIDKHALIRDLFPTLKNPDNFVMNTVFPNVSPFVNKSIPISPYNPALAKQLLKQAGYATDYNGPGKHLSLRFATTNAPVREKDFQILSRYWANVGIHVSPTFASGSPSANNGLFSPYNLNGLLYQRRYDIALFAYSTYPDPQESEPNFLPQYIPTAAKHGSGEENYNGITDPVQANLLIQARHTLDVAQRHALFNQWQQRVASQVFWIPLYTRTNITVDDGKIGNYSPNPTQAGNEWNLYQWYVKGAS